jgi:hypothetical protein
VAPVGGEERDFGERTMGVGDRQGAQVEMSTPADVGSSQKNIAAGRIPLPPDGRGNGTPQKDDGGGLHFRCDRGKSLRLYVHYIRTIHRAMLAMLANPNNLVEV